MPDNNSNTPLHNPRRRSSIPYKNDVEITTSNSTASRFLGNRRKSWMQTSGTGSTFSVNPNSSSPKKPTYHSAAAAEEIVSCPPKSPSSVQPRIQTQPSQPHGKEHTPSSPGKQQDDNDGQGPATEQLLKEFNESTSIGPKAPPPPSPDPSRKSTTPAISIEADIMKLLANHNTASGEEVSSPSSRRQLATPGSDANRGHQNELRATVTTYPQEVHSQQTTSAGIAPHVGPDNHRDKRARVGEQESSTVSSLGQPVVPSNGNRVNTLNVEPGSIAVSEPLTSATLKAHVRMLDQLREQFGENDRSHLQLLRDACTKGDIVFLALHQMHCLNIASPEMLRLLPKFGSVESNGLRVIIHLWNRNMIHAPRFLEIFSRFPAPFHLLVEQNHSYFIALQSAMLCLPIISREWPRFIEAIVARGYPPLVDEIVAKLSAYSDVLQFVLFTSCCNRLRGNRPQRLLFDWRSVFQTNREFYKQRLARLNTANPVSTAQMQLENETLISQYKSLQNVPPELMATNQAFHPQQNFPNTTATLSQGLHAFQAHLPNQGSRHHTQQQRAFPDSHHVPVPPVPSPAFQPHQNIAVNKNFQQSSLNWSGPASNPQMVQPSLSYATSQPTVPVNGMRTASANLPSVPVQQRAAPLPARATTNPLVPQHPSPISSTRIFPPVGFTPSEMANPNPLIVGLHQSHLKVTTKPVSRQGVIDGSIPLFRYLTSFAVTPSILSFQIPIFQWHLTIPPDQFRRMPLLIPSGQKDSSIQGVVDGSLTYQVRCVKVNSLTEHMPMEKWAVMDCSWPNAIYIHVNGKEQFVRRKFHHGKDVPLEITQSLKQGNNEIKLTLLRDVAEAAKTHYAMAIEVLDTAGPQRVRGMVKTISASTSLNRVAKRLTNSPSDDDELSIVDDHITIDLIDPFMSRIFDTPVRSLSCSHSECFDLETFLSTRLSRAAKGRHGMAEDWKCPICSKDARPQSLMIDQFLVDVRAELARQKQLDSVKAIEVRRGGDWKPRETPATGISTAPERTGCQKTPSVNLDGQPPSAGPSAPASATPEIIELD